MISCACFMFSTLNSKAIYCGDQSSSTRRRDDGRPSDCYTACHDAMYNSRYHVEFERSLYTYNKESI